MHEHGDDLPAAMLAAFVKDPQGSWPLVIAPDPSHGPGRVLLDDQRDTHQVIVCPLTTTALPPTDPRVTAAVAAAQRLHRYLPMPPGSHGVPATVVYNVDDRLRVVCWVFRSRNPQSVAWAKGLATVTAASAPLVAAGLPDPQPISTLALPPALRELVAVASGYAARACAPRVTVPHVAAALLRSTQPVTLWHDQDDPAEPGPDPDGSALHVLEAAALHTDPLPRLQSLLIEALACPDSPRDRPLDETPGGPARLAPAIDAHPDWLRAPVAARPATTRSARTVVAQLSRMNPPALVKAICPPGPGRDQLVDDIAAALVGTRPVLVAFRDHWHLGACSDLVSVLRTLPRSLVLIVDGALDGPNIDTTGIELLVWRALDRNLRVLLTASTDTPLDIPGTQVTVPAAAATAPHPPPPQPPQLDDHAHLLATYHSVAITAEAVAAAAQPPPPDCPELQHPALGIDRLDLAAATASQRIDRTVTAADIPVDPTAAGHQSLLDPAAVRNSLQRGVVGQDTEAITAALTSAATGLRHQPGPLWVGLLAGPRGTGKTSTAIAIADGYGGPDHLIRVDCGGLYSDHTASSLLGSPPGYVGSDAPERWLTTRLNELQFGVLLLDEIEKAAPRILDIFLAALSDGVLVDLQGRSADLAKFIVILTTNIGSHHFTTPSAGFTPNGHDDAESAVRRQLRDNLRPEFLDRLEVLVYRPLTHDTLRTLADRRLHELANRAAAAGYIIDFHPTLLDAIIHMASTSGPGARDLARIIDLHLARPLLQQPPGQYQARLDAQGQIHWEAPCGYMTPPQLPTSAHRSRGELLS